ncbi:Inositol monophosphatase 3 [Dirofilaria immitis]|nr:Inositol monophosphatase 3 [Dirofilaria immitis]
MWSLIPVQIALESERNDVYSAETCKFYDIYYRNFLSLSELSHLGKEEYFPDVVVDLHDLLSYVLLAIELGGHAILDINDEQKADLLSNQLIINVLKRYPGIKVISEEKNEKLSVVDYERYQSKQQELYANVKTIVDLFPSRKYSLSKLALWIDPLDATQEFTEGLFEYVSVMTCISLNGIPIFGVIYRPFTGEKVYGLNEFGIIKGNGDKWERTVLKDSSKLIMITCWECEELASKTFFANFTIEAAGGSGYKSLRLLNGTGQLYVHKTAIKNGTPVPVMLCFDRLVV